MASADSFLRFNNFMFSRTSVSTKISGVPYEGIFEVAVDESREGELQYGQRVDGTPLGYTSGLYKPGSLTFKAYIDSASMIEQQLAAVAGVTGTLIPGSFGNAQFSFTLEIFESLAQPTISVQVNGCKIQKRKVMVPTDTAALANEYECLFLSMQVIGAGPGLSGLPAILANYTAVL